MSDVHILPLIMIIGCCFFQVSGKRKTNCPSRLNEEVFQLSFNEYVFPVLLFERKKKHVGAEFFFFIYFLVSNNVATEDNATTAIVTRVPRNDVMYFLATRKASHWINESRRSFCVRHDIRIDSTVHQI